MLYRSTDRRRRAGAPMENLAHSASFHSNEKSAPSKPGTKQLGMEAGNRLPTRGTIMMLPQAALEGGLVVSPGRSWGHWFPLPKGWRGGHNGKCRARALGGRRW